MNVEQLMTRDIATCRPGEMVDEAARVMWSNDCGCVPVVAEDGSGRAVGMLTDRDICMAAYLQGKRLDEIRVEEAMARELCGCRPRDSIQEAEKTMSDAQVRRLVVTDDDRRLLGLLSLADIARAAARGGDGADPGAEGIGNALASITRPRREASAMAQA